MEELTSANVWQKLAERFPPTDTAFWLGAMACQCLALGVPREAIELAVPDCQNSVARFLTETLQHYRYTTQEAEADENQG